MVKNELSFSKEKEMDIVLIGRVAVDLNSNEIHVPMEETKTFTKYVGGSPANIAIGMARLGNKVGFIGRVSDDQFGRFVTTYFKNENIDTSNIVIDDKGAKTGLTFTEIKSPTESSILMYREGVADLQISPEDVSEEYVKNAKTLLVSGTALSKSPSREACFVAMEYAIKHDVKIIFDIDYRPYSWQSEKEIGVYYSLAAQMSHIIIGSKDEFALCEMFMANENETDEDTANRWFGYKAEVVVIKHGGDGSIGYVNNGDKYKVSIFPVELLKSFGGGDAYASAFIHSLMKGKDIGESLEYGSASAAMLVSSHSCSDAMPVVEALEEFTNEAKEKYGSMIEKL